MCLKFGKCFQICQKTLAGSYLSVLPFQEKDFHVSVHLDQEGRLSCGTGLSRDILVF